MAEDCAVPVVELGKNGGYRLNEEELEEILLNEEYKDKKVAVISVAGAFRKGKSFLLNFFVHYLEWLESGEEGHWFDEETVLDKFHWRGGSKRDTHGIIMWNKPYLIQDKYDEEIVVLLMDTQGTFDHNSTVQECATIFAMSTLLSSIQIFNVSQQIQEDDLQNLRLFTEYANLAQKSTKTTPFQKLLFLVRDWQNSDEHGYGYEGGADYLDELLKITKGQKKELQSLRKNLGNSFAEMQSFLMPHPGLKIAKNNSEQVLGEIDEEFEEQIEIFVPSVLEKAEIEAKKIAGNEITCGELFQLFKAYMKIFNSDELPEPKSIFEATAKAAVMAAEESSRAEYDRMIDDFMEVNPNLSSVKMLQSNHEMAKKWALKVFDNKPMLGNDEMITTYRNRLYYGIEARYGELKEHVVEREMAEERKKRLEEVRKTMEEERKVNEAKAAAEREKIKKEREEQERKRQEMEEEQRRRDAENKRREEEFRRREEQRKKEEDEAQERRRRQEDRARQERERLAEERRQMEKQQSDQLANLMMQMDRNARSIQSSQRRSYSPPNGGFNPSFFCSPASSGYGSSFSTPSRNATPDRSPVRGTYFDERVNRWRDRDGRFAKNPHADYSSPSPSTPSRSSGQPTYDANVGRWRLNGRFCKAPQDD